MSLGAALQRWAGIWALAASGCDPGQTECACQPTGLLLHVCPALSDQVQSIDLTGSACSGATKRLVDASAEAGWTTYEIQPTQPGQCSLEVTFKNGLTFAADAPPNPLLINHGPGCCSGLYPDPIGAGDIQACPEGGAPADAGGTLDAMDGP